MSLGKTDNRANPWNSYKEMINSLLINSDKHIQHPRCNHRASISRFSVKTVSHSPPRQPPAAALLEPGTWYRDNQAVHLELLQISCRSGDSCHHRIHFKRTIWPQMLRLPSCLWLHPAWQTYHLRSNPKDLTFPRHLADLSSLSHAFCSSEIQPERVNRAEWLHKRMCHTRGRFCVTNGPTFVRAITLCLFFVYSQDTMQAFFLLDKEEKRKGPSKAAVIDCGQLVPELST